MTNAAFGRFTPDGPNLRVAVRAWGLLSLFAIGLGTPVWTVPLVLAFVLVGAGVPAAVELVDRSDTELDRELRGLLVVVLSVVVSFAISALVGQPLLWTNHWTEGRHLMAVVLGAEIVTWTVRVSDRDEPAPEISRSDVDVEMDGAAG